MKKIFNSNNNSRNISADNKKQIEVNENEDIPDELEQN